MIRTIILSAAAVILAGCVSQAPDAGALADTGSDAGLADTTDGGGGADGSNSPDATVGPPGTVSVTPTQLEVSLPTAIEVTVVNDAGVEVALGPNDYELQSQDIALVVDSNGAVTASEPGEFVVTIFGEKEINLVTLEATLEFEDISAGYNFACAITARGRAWCWGVNTEGQLGRGTVNEGSAIPEPIDHANISEPLVSVDCGQVSCIALSESGRMYSWGAGYDLRLGYDTAGRLVSVARAILAAGESNQQLSVGRSHACVINSAGELACWGRSVAGQIPGSIMEDNAYRQVATGPFQSVDAGDSGTCVLDTSGVVQCVGAKSFFAEMTTNEFPVTTLTPISAGGGLLTASQIAVGDNHACALVDGSLTCWGSQAAVGDLATLDPSPPLAIAPLQEEILEIQAKQGLTAMRTASGWSVLGLGCSGSQATGLQGSPGAVASVDFQSPIKSLGLGRCTTCLVSETNEIYCSGENSLANGANSTDDQFSPVKVPFAWETGM